MNSQKSIIKYVLTVVLVAAVVVAGYFIFKGKIAVNSASLHNIPAVSTGCHPTIGPNGQISAPTPSIVVISPNGGENYHPGDQVLVKWTTCNIPATATMIIGLNGFEPGNIGGYSIINTPNDGSEIITLPLSTQFGSVPGQWHYGTWYKMNVSLQNNVNTGPFYRDLSDDLFSINAAATTCDPNAVTIVINPAPPQAQLVSLGQMGVHVGDMVFTNTSPTCAFKVRKIITNALINISSSTAQQFTQNFFAAIPFKFYRNGTLLGQGSANTGGANITAGGISPGTSMVMSVYMNIPSISGYTGIPFGPQSSTTLIEGANGTTVQIWPQNVSTPYGFVPNLTMFTVQ